MKEKSESEPSSSPSSVPGPSVPGPSAPGPSAPGPSAPGEQIIQTISEQEFYALVNSQEEILVKQFNDHREEYAKKDINQVFSDIFKDFYEVQEKLKKCKIQKVDENIININNDNNNNTQKEMTEIIDAILAEIFFEKPFDEYTNKFYGKCKELSKEFLAKNILEGNKVSFVEYLEKEIFKTKLPHFVNNLLIMVITDKDQAERDRHLMDQEERRRYDERIRVYERKEDKVKIEDWDLDKVLSKLDTPKEKERLKPILKEMEEDLKPKTSYFEVWKSPEYCEKTFLENKAKFNIIAMNKFYLDMEHITICISGFLTEQQEHFSGWKEFVRNNNQVTFYYFLNWPSESGLSSFLNFTQAKKRANYFGKILANMIVSEKFFKNKKITLVGHSLGCHFIKCCLKEIAENKDEDFQGVDTKIDKIIFLGGATQIKDKKRWTDIFKKVTKGNINNFYSTNDKALSIMQTRLVWGKKAIGRHPLIIQGIDVHNYDCSNITFDDMLGHGYKQIYGKIVQYFNL